MERCLTCGNACSGLFGNTKCACCHRWFCHDCYATHWNGLIPIYQITHKDTGEGGRWHRKEDADAEYIWRLRHLREQAVPHPFFSSPKDNQAKRDAFKQAVEKIVYETTLMTQEEWDDVYGPNHTAIWEA